VYNIGSSFKEPLLVIESKIMKKRTYNTQGGFAPFIAVLIVAALAIGGSVYAVKKNNARKTALEDNVETQANVNADVNANANANANLGINANANANAKAKGSINLFMAMRKNTMCTFEGTDDGMTSTGTVYISAEGNMRGDFTTVKAGTSTESHMIVKSGVAYVWSGSQGAKMNVSSINATTEAQVKNYIDLNKEVDYSCTDWTVDTAKFVLPESINFVDVEAMLKANLKLP